MQAQGGNKQAQGGNKQAQGGNKRAQGGNKQAQGGLASELSLDGLAVSFWLHKWFVLMAALFHTKPNSSTVYT